MGCRITGVVAALSEVFVNGENLTPGFRYLEVAGGIRDGMGDAPQAQNRFQFVIGWRGRFVLASAIFNGQPELVVGVVGNQFQ